MHMKNFLIFRYNKTEKSLDLFSVLNGNSFDSLRRKINKEIENDIYYLPSYKSCSISLTTGIPHKCDNFIEHRIYAFVNPPYSKTIILDYIIREVQERN